MNEEGQDRPLRDGVRAVAGVLAALRDAVAVTFDEIVQTSGAAQGDSAAAGSGPTGARAGAAASGAARNASAGGPRASAAAARPFGARTVREEVWSAEPPILRHPEWATAMPWLVQGISTAGADGTFDLGLSGSSPIGASLRRWRSVRRATGATTVVHATQVHGTDIRRHDSMSEGLLIAEGYDGHITSAAGVLLTVSVADCVPVYIVDERRRAVALVHAGWRGAAAGILEEALHRLNTVLGTASSDVRVHLGPAICGRCYEVGPEVHQALGLPRPDVNTPVDVRAVLAGKAVASGVSRDAVTTSAHCTRCGDGGFFSHRGGHAGRQMGLLGIAAGR